MEHGFTTEQCQAFLDSGPQTFGVGAVPSSQAGAAAINLSTILNKLIELGVKFGAILPKLFQIYNICIGPGSWMEKAALIFALFNVPLPSDPLNPSIVKG